MKNAIRLLLCGSLLLVATVSCRTDKPPAISIICIGDGFGGADCVLASGERQYKSPSELKNYWMTTAVDQQNYSSWCYKTTPSNISREMSAIKESATGE